MDTTHHTLIQRNNAQRKPWSEALERGSFAKPASLAEATARLRKNAAYFRTNYALVMAGSVALGFLMHPSSLFVLAALVAGWVYAFAVRSGPIVVNGRELSEREKVMAMAGISVVVVFFLTNVASVVFSALVFGAGLVAAHGACRVPDDLFIDAFSVPAAGRYYVRLASTGQDAEVTGDWVRCGMVAR